MNSEPLLADSPVDLTSSLTQRSESRGGQVSRDRQFRAMQVQKCCVVIDDEVEFVEQVKRCLTTSGLGYEVVAFSNTLAAVEYIRGRRVDLILTAYLVPQMDGLQFISLVRATNARVPILMLSRVPIRAIALARGATAFLSKSALWTHLVDTIRSIAPHHA